MKPLLRTALTLVTSIALGSGCAGQFDASSAAGFQTLTRKQGTYWAYVPNDAAQREQRGELMPVLVYLHDADARGDDADRATQDGLGTFIAGTQGAYPLVVLFPHLKAGKAWSDPLELADLDRLLDDALRRVGGDPDRVYVTGVGLGGTGTWQLAAANPGRFAAIVPVGGAAGPRLASSIGALPVWSFSGDRAADQALVDALGATAKRTTLQGSGKALAQHAYATPGLADWLLAHHRTVSVPTPAAAPAGT